MFLYNPDKFYFVITCFDSKGKDKHNINIKFLFSRLFFTSILRLKQCPKFDSKNVVWLLYVTSQEHLIDRK